MSFSDVHKDNTPVWKHFLHSKEHELAKCNFYDQEIKCKGGSISSTRNHLRLKHNITFAADVTPEKKVQSYQAH